METSITLSKKGDFSLGQGAYTSPQYEIAAYYAAIASQIVKYTPEKAGVIAFVVDRVEMEKLKIKKFTDADDAYLKKVIYFSIISLHCLKHLAQFIWNNRCEGVKTEGVSGQGIYIGRIASSEKKVQSECSYFKVYIC
jgi:hypothetical protein